MASFTFDCRTMGGFCPTSAGGCSPTTGECLACSPGWEHSYLLVVAKDCFQPTWMQPTFFAATVAVAVPSIAKSLQVTRNLIVYGEHTNEAKLKLRAELGLIRKRWKKRTIVEVNILFQLLIMAYGLSVLLGSTAFSGIFLGLCGTQTFTFIFPIKQRLIHPAFSMSQSSVRRHVEELDYFLLVGGCVSLLPPAVICGVAGFMGNGNLYNIGLLMGLVFSSTNMIVSLAEVVWLSNKVQVLSQQVMHPARSPNNNHSSSTPNNTATASPASTHHISINDRDRNDRPQSKGGAGPNSKQSASGSDDSSDSQMAKAIARIRSVARYAYGMMGSMAVVLVLAILVGVFGTLPFAFVILPLSLLSSSVVITALTLITVGTGIPRGMGPNNNSGVSKLSSAHTKESKTDMYGSKTDMWGSKSDVMAAFHGAPSPTAAALAISMAQPTATTQTQTSASVAPSTPTASASVSTSTTGGNNGNGDVREEA